MVQKVSCILCKLSLANSQTPGSLKSRTIGNEEIVVWVWCALQCAFLRRNKLKTLKSLKKSQFPTCQKSTSALPHWILKNNQLIFKSLHLATSIKCMFFLLWAYLVSALIEQLILSIIAALSADLVQPTLKGLASKLAKPSMHV